MASDDEIDEDDGQEQQDATVVNLLSAAANLSPEQLALHITTHTVRTNTPRVFQVRLPTKNGGFAELAQLAV